MNILVTGGAGFIGSHTIVELLNNNHEVVIIDDFSNSKPNVLESIKVITGKDPVFYKGDCCDATLLEQIFDDHKIDGVIHFVGFKSIGESISIPLDYYQNNLDSLIQVCKVMDKHECRNIIFSSSASVYGIPKSSPISEEAPVGVVTNPYAYTKVIIERILTDLYVSNNQWNVVLLRYFNPVGAHASGLIGESPNDIPNNLLPYVAKVANKELPFVHVFGNDYDTKDGTGVRDYIHVVDLAKGHLAAVNHLNELSGVNIFNLGTGHGYSVLEIIQAFEKANNVNIPYEIEDRRPGDVATCYANSSKAKKLLGWSSTLEIDSMCKDAWHFIQTISKK